MPRTFVGPLALAGVSWPFLRFGAGQGGEIRGQSVGESEIRIGLGNTFGLEKQWGREEADS